MILDILKKEAKCKPVRILFPESNDERILKAASIIAKKRYAIPVLLGSPNQIKSEAKKLKIKLKNVEILDYKKSNKVESYAKAFTKLRKHKGMTYKKALQLLKQPNYFGCMMVHQNHVDAMITGASHTTADSVRPALQIIKPKKGVKWVSGAFFTVCNTSKNCLLFADCAVIEHPTSQQLAEIAIESAKTYEFFVQEKARVALLSFSTKGSASDPDLKKIQKAVQIAKKKNPKLCIDGELQVDAALRPEVAKLKCPKSPIKGNANVLVFPSLEAGNIGVKLINYFAGMELIGPFLQGLSKPVQDLSRGSTVSEIVNLAIFTSVEVCRGYRGNNNN